MALLVTHIAAATAALVWDVYRTVAKIRFGRHCLVGIVLPARLLDWQPSYASIWVHHDMPSGFILSLAGERVSLLYRR